PRRPPDARRDPSLARAELDELEDVRASAAAPHLLDLARQKGAEGAVDAAARDVIAASPSANPPGVIAEGRMIQAQFHEARERNRAARRNLGGDLRLQAVARVRDGHRSAPRDSRHLVPG